jgi:hypothetical protein
LYRLRQGWAAGFILLTERLQHGAPVEALSQPPSLDLVFNYFAGHLFDRARPTLACCYCV